MKLETERTVIRYFRESDWKDLYEYLSLSDTYKYEPGSPITLERAKEIAKEKERGTNFIAVIDKEWDKLIGHFSFFPSGPDYIRTFELGYIFNPKFQRKGLATESGMAFLEYCFKQLKAHKVTANCNPCNESSWKLLERLGFTREGYLKKNVYFKEDDGKPLWVDTFVYGLLNANE
jgi:RimJ/RimL family protein N-acetyltransferase